MSFNLTAGNPLAHRIRVYFEGSTTIYEGMPVCYNYDTTTNWFGGSIAWAPGADSGAVTTSTTTAEGSQNEGKYIRVERPVDGNLIHFAGVVAAGGWTGTTGPKAIDIFVPNGAIVPVRCNVDTTVGVTILAISEGNEELGFPAANSTSRPVAIAMETETGLDGTADITLAKLDPNLFVYQTLDGTTLDVGKGTANRVLNSIRATTTQTSGAFCAFECRAYATAGGYANSTTGGGLAAWFRAESSGTLAVSINAVHINLNLTGGTYTDGVKAVLHVKLYTSGATLTSGRLCVLNLDSSVNDAVSSSNLSWMYLENNGSSTPDFLFTMGSITDIPASTASSVTVSHKIHFDVGGTTYYIPCGTIAG